MSFIQNDLQEGKFSIPHLQNVCFFPKTIFERLFLTCLFLNVQPLTKCHNNQNKSKSVSAKSEEYGSDGRISYSNDSCFVECSSSIILDNNFYLPKQNTSNIKLIKLLAINGCSMFCYLIICDTFYIQPDTKQGLLQI